MSSVFPLNDAKTPQSTGDSIEKEKDFGDVDTHSVDDDLVDAEPEPFKLYNYLFRRYLYEPKDLDSDAIAIRRSVYDDPHLAPHY